METKWLIYNIERELTNGLVINVRYGYRVSNGQLSKRYLGEIQLEGDPTSPDFIPYEDLTEEIVVGWVKDKLGAEEVTTIEKQIQALVSEQVAQEEGKETISGLPW